MNLEFIVEVSARHIHLQKADLETLFGEGYELTFLKALSQPGQFVAKEKVTIKTNDRNMSSVSILGPCRQLTQVEISKTDCIALRAPCVIRESGDIEDTPEVTIIGPNGELRLDKGLIIAKRHLHMTPDDAARFNVKDTQIVSVLIEDRYRGLIYNDVVVRVSPSSFLAMHIDTDEANAA